MTERWPLSRLTPYVRNARTHSDEQVAQIAASIAEFGFTNPVLADETGTIIAECPAIPGCVSQGQTKEDALKNIKEAIELCLEVRAERGLPLTVETRQVEVAL